MSTALRGELFLGQGLSLRKASGMAMIMLGLAIMDGRALRRFRHFEGAELIANVWAQKNGPLG